MRIKAKSAKVPGPMTAAVGPHTAARVPTVAVMGPKTFFYWGIQFLFHMHSCRS